MTRSLSSLRISRHPLGLALLLAPLLMAAKGNGCTATAGQDTPNMEGAWALTWQDDLDVEITIGGAVYTSTLGARGGTVTIDHEGMPITFDLDCARPEVVCPSEVWPDTVTLAQRDINFQRNVYVTIPISECDGELVDPDPAACGPNTNNVDCDRVCDGNVTQTEHEAFGLLDNDGDELNVLLGGGIATNGINCAMLGLSLARADLETTGSGVDGDWRAVAMPSAEVVTGYAGGCLWAGDVDDDGTIEALVVGASVKLSTAFTGQRQP